MHFAHHSGQELKFFVSIFEIEITILCSTHVIYDDEPSHHVSYSNNTMYLIPITAVPSLSSFSIILQFTIYVIQLVYKEMEVLVIVYPPHMQICVNMEREKRPTMEYF